MSAGLVAGGFVVAGEHPALSAFVVTGVVVATAMHGRQAMGRWRTAAQIAAGGLVLALLGAPPRAITGTWPLIRN